MKTRKNEIKFDKKLYDDIYNSKKFSRFSYKALFCIDKNIYIFMFGVLTSYSISLFILFKDASITHWVELLVLSVGIVCSIIACILFIKFVVIAINLQEDSQVKLLEDKIIYKTLGAANKNIVNFNCLVVHLLGTGKSLDSLLMQELSTLLLKLSRIRTRLILISFLFGLSFLSVLIIFLVKNFFCC